MRTIKFRGQRSDTKEWVYGGYVFSTNGEWLSCIKYHTIVTENGVLYQVDSETVGQFTGLTDKNGKEIYEGDIVWHKLQGKRVVYYPFNKDTASYGIIHENGMCSMLCDASNLYEVIGNIHDNPEMLEKK